MTLTLQPSRARVARIPLLFRAADCVDETGVYALSYGQKIYAVLSRPSRKRIVDQRGRLFTAPAGAPALGRYGPNLALLSEPARTNLCLRSKSLNTSPWQKQNGATVTSGVAVSADGSVTMDLVSGSATTGGEGVYQIIAFPTDGEKCCAWTLKEGTGDTRVVLSLYDQTAATHRHQVRVTWVNGVPTLQTIAGAGVLLAPEYLHSGMWRIGFSALGVIAANSNRQYLYTAGSSSAFGTVYATDAQAENTVVFSSPIDTEGAAVTRNADVLYFPISFAPRPLTVYVRGLNREVGVNTGAARVNLCLGSSNPAADPRLILYGTGAGNIGGEYDDGITIRQSAPLASPLPALNDVIEQRASLSEGGFFQAGAAVNGGGEVLGSSNGPNIFPSAWNQPRLYLAGGFSSLNASHAYTHVLIAEGERTMAEMRELAGV